MILPWKTQLSIHRVTDGDETHWFSYYHLPKAGGPGRRHVQRQRNDVPWSFWFPRAEAKRVVRVGASGESAIEVAGRENARDGRPMTLRIPSFEAAEFVRLLRQASATLKRYPLAPREWMSLSRTADGRMWRHHIHRPLLDEKPPP